MAQIGRWARFIRSSAWFALGVVGALSAAPAVAQTTATVITPLKVEADQNDVNLATGLIRVSVPTLSTPAAPQLTFDLLQNAMPYLVANISAGPGEYVESSIAVHHGGAASESFRCLNDDVCSNVKLDGAVIEGSIASGGPYYFTHSPSGAVYTFDQLEYDSGGAQPNRKVQYYASTIAYPSGEVISYTYQITPFGSRTLHRISRMNSSLGFYIDFSYQSNDGGQNQWLALAQAKLYNVNAPAAPLGQLTYGPNGTVTDLASRTFTCVGCINSVGAKVEWSSANVTLPGESGPYEAVTASALIPNNYVLPMIVSSVVRDGVTWNYSYSNFRQVPQPQNYTYDSVVVSAPSGFNQTYNIAASSGTRPNLISSTVDSIGRTTTYSYDVNYRPTLVTYPEGNSVQIGYDLYGNITSKVSHPKPGSSLPNITESSAINAANCAQTRVLCFRPTSYTDGLSRTTDYAYDNAGRVIQETAPADAAGVRSVKYFTYGSSYTAPTLVRLCGLTTTCGTSSEIRTEYTYWGQTALPLTETRVDNTAGTSLTTTYAYDNAGRVLSQDGPLPGTDDAIYYRYDVVGRRTWEIGPLGANGVRSARRFSYRDADDKVVASEVGTVPNASSTALAVVQRSDLTYDTRRNPVRETVREATSSSLGTIHTVSDASFDDRGRTICQTVRMNAAAFGSLPADACTLGTQGSAGPDRVTRKVYDAASQLLKVQKAFGTPLQQDYATYTYTGNGKRASIQDANGNLTTYSFDGFDRLGEAHFPSTTTPGQASVTDYEGYVYDAAGNRTTSRKRDGRMFTYTYDALNRVTSKIVPDGCAPIGGGACPAGSATRDVYYSYDVRGLRLQTRLDSQAGADRVEAAYDGYGRLSAVTTVMGGIGRSLNYLYDAAGNRTRITHPDGVRFDMTYDAANRMLNATWWHPATGTVPFLAISYDAQGRRSDINRASSYTGYTYDAASRLAGMNQRFAGGAGNVDATFAYNPASQMTTRARNNDDYTFPGYVNVNRTYAVNGLNQYTTAGPATFAYDANGNLIADGTKSYGYDAENRLISTSTGVSLAYDPMGRLWRTAGGSLGASQFLYDGDALVAEYDGDTGSMRRRFMHGPGVDEPILWDEGSGMNCSGTKFLHTDHQGSIVALANCYGNRIAVNAYDEYGIPATGNVGRFQYTGQVWIPELGMYYYKARVYSPTLGRFMQTDPIGYDDQVNLYAYVANDPVNHTDPSGEEGACIYSPGMCGLRELTPQQQRERDQAAATMGGVGLTVASLFVGPELLGIRFGGAIAIRVGGALFRAGDAASTRLAESAVLKAANSTLSGLAKGEGRAIAGNGSKDALREAGNLAKKYGGEAGDYQKVSSRTIAESSNGAKVEVHAYRNVDTGKIYEPKIKVQGGN